MHLERIERIREPRPRWQRDQGHQKQQLMTHALLPPFSPVSFDGCLFASMSSKSLPHLSPLPGAKRRSPDTSARKKETKQTHLEDARDG